MAKRRSKDEEKGRASEDRSASESPEPRPPDGDTPKRGRKSAVEKVRSGLAGLGAAVVIMVLIAVLAYIAWPTLRPVADRQPSDPTPLIEARLSDLEGLLDRKGTETGDLAARLDDADATVAALDDRLATIEQEEAEVGSGIAQRLAALEEQPALSPNEGGVVAGLAERIETLERAVAESTPDALESRRDQIAALDARLAGLEERLATASAVDQASPAPLSERIEALERMVESAPGDDALRRLGSRTENVVELVDDIAGRLAGLERRIAASAAAGPAMMLAVGQLRAALRSSGPFEQELEAVRAVAPDDDDVADALETLAQRGAKGVPTVEVLRADFDKIAGLTVMRAKYAPDEGTWVARTIARLAGLVTWRRVGDGVPADSIDGIVERTEARLRDDDLAAAVAEIENLKGPPAKVVADWLAAARARIDADRALATLDSRAIAALAGD